MSNSIMCTEWTPEQLAVMHVFTMYKASARKEYLDRLGLGCFSTDNPYIAQLVTEDVILVSRNGSLTPNKKIMTEIMGKTPRTCLGRFRQKLENVSLNFPISGDEDEA